MAGFSKMDHRANRLLAAIDPGDDARVEPHLEIVELPRGTIVYEAGETMPHAYFPHDPIVLVGGRDGERRDRRGGGVRL